MSNPLVVPAWENYGKYSSNNYGAHSLAFTANGKKFWFSYSTLVAFFSPKTGHVVHENIWTVTTGKHLNWIDGGNREAKKERVNQERFFELLRVAQES